MARGKKGVVLSEVREKKKELVPAGRVSVG